MERNVSETVGTPTAVRPRPQRFLTGAVLKVVVWIVTIQVALQPVFAGGFLDGNATAHELHSTNGVLLELSALVLLVTSILAWRPGRAPGRVAFAGTLMFLVIQFQAGVGHGRFLSIHVPLGVATMVLMLWLLLSVRNLRPVPRSAPRS